MWLVPFVARACTGERRAAAAARRWARSRGKGRRPWGLWFVRYTSSSTPASAAQPSAASPCRPAAHGGDRAGSISPV